MKKVILGLALLSLPFAAMAAPSRNGDGDGQGGNNQGGNNQGGNNPPPSHMAAPEIDPGTALSGLTLLAGGLAVIRGRRRRE